MVFQSISFKINPDYREIYGPSARVPVSVFVYLGALERWNRCRCTRLEKKRKTRATYNAGLGLIDRAQLGEDDSRSGQLLRARTRTCTRHRAAQLEWDPEQDYDHIGRIDSCQLGLERR